MNFRELLDRAQEASGIEDTPVAKVLLNPGLTATERKDGLAKHWATDIYMLREVLGGEVKILFDELLNMTANALTKAKLQIEVNNAVEEIIDTAGAKLTKDNAKGEGND